MIDLLGPFMVMLFCLSQAFRDVYFGHVFQELDYFAVVVLAFGLSTVIFGLLTALRRPGDFTVLRRHKGTVAAMNATTRSPGPVISSASSISSPRSSTPSTAAWRP